MTKARRAAPSAAVRAHAAGRARRRGSHRQVRDGIARQMATDVWKLDSVGYVEAIDLHDATRGYLYTLFGDPLS